LGSLYALAIAVTERSYLWLGVAMATDLLAIWSAGSGVFLIVPAALLCLWLRSFNGFALAFFGAHALFLWHFFSDYRWRVRRTPKGHGFGDKIINTFAFAGWPYIGARPLAGAVGLVTFAYLSVVAALQRDRNLSILVAFATFALIEGVSIAYSRPSGINERHATIALMFSAAVISAMWRCPKTSGTAPVVAIIAVIWANAPIYERQWRWFSRQLDHAAYTVKAGIDDPKIMKWVGPRTKSPGMMNFKRLRKERLGPFAD
jgi:hypothetical protein